MNKKCWNCGIDISPETDCCPSCGAAIKAEWYYVNDNNPVGPYTEQEIISLFNQNIIQKDTLVWNESLTEWISLEKSGLLNNEEKSDQEKVEETEDKIWYLAIDDKPQGPYTEEEISQKALRNEINPASMIWKEGMEEWVKIKDSMISNVLPKEESEWYYAENDENHGPITETELIELIQKGQLSGTNLIWKQGWPNWNEVGSTELSKYVTKIEPVQQIEQPVNIERNIQDKKTKKGWVYLLIGALLISLGGGSFMAYQNKTKKEMEQLEIAKKESEEKAEKAKKELEKQKEEAKKSEEQAKKEEEDKEKQENQKDQQNTNVVYRSVVSDLNRRSGPGENYSKTGMLSTDNLVEITETSESDGYLWGKTVDGDYVCIRKGSDVYLVKNK